MAMHGFDIDKYEEIGLSYYSIIVLQKKEKIT